MAEYIFQPENGSSSLTSGIEDMCALLPNDWYGTIHEEIVRCKDCARFVPQGTYRFNSGAVNKDTCEVIRGFVVQIDPNGFCAWGERI